MRIAFVQTFEIEAPDEIKPAHCEGTLVLFEVI